MDSSGNSDRRTLHECHAQRMMSRRNAASGTAPPPKPTSKDSDGGDDASSDTTFECNVCFDVPRDPVVTPCGHLYCWPCLYRWMGVHADSPECPVCKAGVDKTTVIPIYGRGRSQADDPRLRPLPDDEDVPPRPSGHRAPPLRQRINTPYVHHTFGINAYPGNYEFSFSNFGLFPSIFGLQIAYPRANEPLRDDPDEHEEGITDLGMSPSSLHSITSCFS